MDRCALFVDASYVLADGAMAVHGTRRRESVSWDYQGLLQLLANLATERSGLPLLRCYWYEATVEGRRSADHDVLADIPGVKLRLAKMRPRRREGVESEIHRDLETLARNKAVSDAFVVSAEEDLAPIVAEVQDLGLRVTMLHIAADGDWTISRALRQECDDLVEISSEHLRPYVELISGAEPPRADEPDGAALIALRPTANGYGHHAARPDLVPAPQDGAAASREPFAATANGSPAGSEFAGISPDAGVVQADAYAIRQDADPAVGQEIGLAQQDTVPVRRDLAAERQEPPVSVGPWGAQPTGQRGDPGMRQELYAAPVAAPAPAVDQPAELPAARSRQVADLSGYTPGAAREPAPGDAAIRDRFAREPAPGDASPEPQPAAAVPGTAQIHRLPTRGGGPGAQAPAPSPPAPSPAGQAPARQAPTALPPLPAPTVTQPAIGNPAAVQPTAVQPAVVQPAAPVMPIHPAAGYAPGRNGSYSGPQPVVPGAPPPSPVGVPGGQPDTGLQGVPGPVAPPGAFGPVSATGPAYAPGPAGAGSGLPGPVAYPNAQPSVSLAEAVQSAHDEGQEFGTSVARDAPALWLEAVLARKPRMPSDLEARLLQGSALPIDFLLHDEVRHALRRGFWDALERARR